MMRVKFERYHYRYDHSSFGISAHLDAPFTGRAHVTLQVEAGRHQWLWVLMVTRRVKRSV